MINVYSSVYMPSKTKIGGYCYIIKQNNEIPIIHGFKRFESITNSKLELLCILDSLKNLCSLKLQKNKVILHYSSKYIENIFKEYNYKKSNYIDIINKIKELSGLFDIATQFTLPTHINFWQNLSYNLAKEASIGNKIL